MPLVKRVLGSAILGIVLLSPIGPVGCQKQTGVDAPTATPRQQISAYNGVVLEANLAMVRVLVQNVDAGAIDPKQKLVILGWNERVAVAGKRLAQLLKDEKIPLNSAEFSLAIADFAIPQVVSGITASPQITAQLGALTAAIRILVSQFVTTPALQGGLYLPPAQVSFNRREVVLP